MVTAFRCPLCFAIYLAAAHVSAVEASIFIRPSISQFLSFFLPGGIESLGPFSKRRPRSFLIAEESSDQPTFIAFGFQLICTWTDFENRL
ncbi:MAG: hypothetical protein INR71_11875 [Terriglobus roseus]|nr:hypothetical protein [Terriglobus roseus]